MDMAPRSPDTAPKRPEQWSDWRTKRRSWFFYPFALFDWSCSWGIYYVGDWALLRLVDNLAKLSVVVVVFLFFWEAGDRAKDRHYRAWQVINESEGKASTGGRIEALEDLVRDRVSLEFVQLPTAQLPRLQGSGATLSKSNLRATFLIYAKLGSAYLDSHPSG